MATSPSTWGRPRSIRCPSTAQIDGVAYQGTRLSMGNPHLVCPVADPAVLDLTRAPAVPADRFPDGVNVEFYSETPAGLVMRVHERGSGETLSCGTGACAVAVAYAVSRGEQAADVIIDVPGGRLRVVWEGATVMLHGPAHIVAAGKWWMKSLEVAQTLALPTGYLGGRWMASKATYVYGGELGFRPDAASTTSAAAPRSGDVRPEVVTSAMTFFPSARRGTDVARGPGRHGAVGSIGGFLRMLLALGQRPTFRGGGTWAHDRAAGEGDRHRRRRHRWRCSPDGAKRLDRATCPLWRLT